MEVFERVVEEFMCACREESKLTHNTLRMYACDLQQYGEWVENRDYCSPEIIHSYFLYLGERYSPSTVKRKLATLSAFMSFLQERGHIAFSPFVNMRERVKVPQRLPKVISTPTLKQLFAFLYDVSLESANDVHLLRDRAIFELLIGTGIQVSELCALNASDVDVEGKTLRIVGSGSKERIMQIENSMTLQALKDYSARIKRTSMDRAFFFNGANKRISTRNVRDMIDRRVQKAGICQKITPQMFRHTFATMLVENDVDIRYVQKLLGHSSLRTTEIYTQVKPDKLREIMALNNPRNQIDR
ncbi:MAG: tyrosine-type recombinase/integrase [Actinomycetaceae bacterium]|nr:tyrosine-type recombinase/integrase [Actinomycetaceae bacterium]